MSSDGLDENVWLYVQRSGDKFIEKQPELRAHFKCTCSRYSRIKDEFNFSIIHVFKQYTTVGYGLLGFFTATHDV